MIEIIPSDKAWLKRNFSGMKVSSPHRLQGELAICVSLVDRATRKYRPFLPDHGPLDENVRKEHGFVEDRFRIAACFPKQGEPKIYEIDGRLSANAQARNLSPLEMHMYKDWRACLGHPDTIANACWENMKIQNFFMEFLIPYFYFHGYWDKYGEPPWEGLSHCIAIATFEQIAEEPHKVEIYVNRIRNQLGMKQFMSYFTTYATPDAEKGMAIFIEWLRRHNENELLAHIQAFNPPQGGGRR